MKRQIYILCMISMMTLTVFNASCGGTAPITGDTGETTSEGADDGTDVTADESAEQEEAEEEALSVFAVAFRDSSYGFYYILDNGYYTSSAEYTDYIVSSAQFNSDYSTYFCYKTVDDSVVSRTYGYTSTTSYNYNREAECYIGTYSFTYTDEETLSITMNFAIDNNYRYYRSYNSCYGTYSDSCSGPDDPIESVSSVNTDETCSFEITYTELAGSGTANGLQSCVSLFTTPGGSEVFYLTDDDMTSTYGTALTATPEAN